MPNSHSPGLHWRPLERTRHLCKFAWPPTTRPFACRRPPAPELSLAAASIERRLNVQLAEKSLLQAEVNLTAARRAKKEGDAKTTTALTNAQTALKTALRRGPTRSPRSISHRPTTHISPPFIRRPARVGERRWPAGSHRPTIRSRRGVAVNHIWLRHFGTPLVPTVFDFGMNGKPPTNQPLLDWLAVELIESGWRMKHDSQADRDEPHIPPCLVSRNDQ